MNQVPKIYRGRILLCLAMILLSGRYVCSQSSYQVTGKVVDNDGTPIAGATVYVEPERYPELWERRIEPVITDASGLFSKVIAKNGRTFGQTFRVFVLLEDGDGIETVFAPFDTLRGLPRFRGVAVVLRDKDVINLGNLPVRFRFQTISVNYSKCSCDIDWSNIYMRIRKGSEVAYFGSISKSDIQRYVDREKKRISLTLPVGAWKLEIVDSGPRPTIVASTGVFIVNPEVEATVALKRRNISKR
jgi:hypothetical protein